MLQIVSQNLTFNPVMKNGKLADANVLFPRGALLKRTVFNE